MSVMMLCSSLLVFIFSLRGVSASGVLVVYANKSAEVAQGEDGLLHCRFDKGKKETDEGDITVIWRSEDKHTGPIIFQCSKNSRNCSRSVGRFSLVGNIENDNASLLITDARMSDADTYFCRVELTGSDKYTAEGLNLKVTKPRKLHSIFVRIDENGTTFVTCIVIGDPPPSVMWVEPNLTAASDVDQLSSYATLSSVPVQVFNVTYTCQISTSKGIQNLSISSTSLCNNMRSDNVTNNQYDWKLILILILMCVLILVGLAVATFALRRPREGKKEEIEVQPTYGNVLPPPRRQQRMNIYKE
ncbi:sialic acid-binding Ig-like lectin 15 [Sardina pilchardus]|uniref:sialic acid-binding Ig-like lectin 15 n=1 Tax=Sardina pilchardus TaxID=27697 RepID=UPI002E0D15EB